MVGIRSISRTSSLTLLHVSPQRELHKHAQAKEPANNGCMKTSFPVYVRSVTIMTVVMVTGDARCKVDGGLDYTQG